VLVLVAGLVVYRLAVGSVSDPQPTAGRDKPWVIVPQENVELVVSDGELQQILNRVQPPAKPANTNTFVHALRLWGPNATFASAPSGQQLLGYFLDDAEYRALAGAAAPPIFEYTAEGLLRARSFDDRVTDRITSSNHNDDLLATFAESGVPLDTPIHLREGVASVRELADSALKEFHLARHEYEWTAIAYARYVFPNKRWKNKYGETITVDDLVTELVEHPHGIGPCNGLHRLEALVVLYRADEQAHVLSPQTRRKLLTHLKQVSDLLVQSQTDEGYWTRNWPRGAAGTVDAKATVYDKLLVTGHQLEWLALAPEIVQPPRENIVRAGRWTVKTILEMSAEDFRRYYGPFSHAARALCLWRGKEPGEVWGKAVPVVADSIP
jgi:hypothetical protein